MGLDNDDDGIGIENDDDDDDGNDAMPRTTSPGGVARKGGAIAEQGEREWFFFDCRRGKTGTKIKREDVAWMNHSPGRSDCMIIAIRTHHSGILPFPLSLALCLLFSPSQSSAKDEALRATGIGNATFEEGEGGYVKEAGGLKYTAGDRHGGSGLGPFGRPRVVSLRREMEGGKGIARESE